MSEPLDIMRKRLHMRSIRRGIKEMDLILTDFATRHLGQMEAAELAVYDALLSENDHDLYQWVSGQTEVPEPYHDVMGVIRAGAVGVTKP